MQKLALAFLAISILSGCARTPRPARPALKARVSFTIQPQCTLVHVALEQGYFAQEGLEVESTLNTYGKAALQALLDGKADFATVAETPVMFNALKGETFLLIANIEASNMNNGIVARKDAGIARAADLKGKRVGFTPGTTSDFFLDSMLTTLGLSRRAIRAVPLKPEEMAGAILAGRVDAACTWNYPLAQIQHQLGANGVAFFDRDIYTETFNLATTARFVESNPEAVQGFLRALFKAEQFVAERPAQAQAIMARATGTDAAVVREVWDAFNYHVRLDQTLLITLEDETRWAMKQKLTDRVAMPDYRKFIRPESLRKARPEAVSLAW